MIPLSDDQPTLHPPIVTILVIAINLLVFAMWQVGTGVEQTVAVAGFVPLAFTRHMPGGVTHLVTSMFMHASWMHLLGNMWFLWIFGKNVEDVCGHIRFACFYVLCGASATFLYTIGSPYSLVPLVGASGAISGVLGAYLLKFPRSSVRALVPLGFFSRIVDLPAWVFLLIWMGMQIFFQVLRSAHTEGGESGGVAYLAHIGGFVAGIALIFIFQQSGASSAARGSGDPW